MTRQELLDREKKFLEEIKKGKEGEFFLTGIETLYAAVRENIFSEFENLKISPEVESCKNQLFVLRIKLEVLDEMKVYLRQRITDGLVAQEDLKELREG